MIDRPVAVFTCEPRLIAGANNIKIGILPLRKKLQFCAQIYYQRKKTSGEPKLLPEDEMENWRRQF